MSVRNWIMRCSAICSEAGSPRASGADPARRSRHRRGRSRLLLPLVVVAAVMALTSTAYADPLTDLEAPFKEALESESMLLALGLVFLGGLATSLTPDV